MWLGCESIVGDKLTARGTWRSAGALQPLAFSAINIPLRWSEECAQFARAAKAYRTLCPLSLLWTADPSRALAQLLDRFALLAKLESNPRVVQ